MLSEFLILNYFKTILDTSLSQVIDTRKLLRKHLLGSKIELSNMENGYIGSLVFNYKNNREYKKNRELLLSLLSENRIVVTLGASMNFAFDKDREFIRLNYYINKEQLISSINTIKTFEQYF